MPTNTGSNKYCQDWFLFFLLILGVVADDTSKTLLDFNAEEDIIEDDVNTNWKWRPEVPHPCTVNRMTAVEYDEIFASTGGIPALYQHPLVITAERQYNEQFRNVTTEKNIVSNFPQGFQVTLSSSNSFSQHRRTIPLEQYLNEMKQNHGTTSPHQLSNTSWYLFGETFTEEWKELLQRYNLPSCQTCHYNYSALSFGIGNRGSGVQWHIHGPGFSEALHGRKHWILYPPHYHPPHFHHDQSTRNWMEYIYTNETKLKEYYEQKINNNTEEKSKNKIENLQSQPYPVLSNGRPYECTLEPGDLIYFPDRWHHATINLDFYTAFVSVFTSDHLYLQDQQQQQQQQLQQQRQRKKFEL